MIRISAILTTVLATAIATPFNTQADADAMPVVSGALTKGGEGGKEYVVSNLNDDGPGSLRAALDKPGPAFVSFKVGGVIRLQTPPQDQGIPRDRGG